MEKLQTSFTYVCKNLVLAMTRLLCHSGVNWSAILMILIEERIDEVKKFW